MNHSVSVRTAGLLKFRCKGSCLPTAIFTDNRIYWFTLFNNNHQNSKNNKCLSLPDAGLCEYLKKKKKKTPTKSKYVPFSHYSISNLYIERSSTRALFFPCSEEEPGLPAIFSDFPGNWWFLCLHLNSCPASPSPWQDEHRGHGKWISVVQNSNQGSCPLNRRPWVLGFTRTEVSFSVTAKWRRIISV